ncbi:hypothetical protein [Algicola sagamiensis]|uniref:hypothetical protein n=1 Tax=Algicola sagamiensis TaxID=163869 RepID=UPI0003724C24|nr:hypothetical protein [Algicola sagamiensis]
MELNQKIIFPSALSILCISMMTGCGGSSGGGQSDDKTPPVVGGTSCGTSLEFKNNINRTIQVASTKKATDKDHWESPRFSFSLDTNNIGTGGSQINSTVDKCIKLADTLGKATNATDDQGTQFFFDPTLYLTFEDVDFLTIQDWDAQGGNTDIGPAKIKTAAFRIPTLSSDGKTSYEADDAREAPNATLTCPDNMFTFEYQISPSDTNHGADICQANDVDPTRFDCLSLTVKLSDTFESCSLNVSSVKVPNQNRQYQFSTSLKGTLKQTAPNLYQIQFTEASVK